MCGPGWGAGRFLSVFRKRRAPVTAPPPPPPADPIGSIDFGLVPWRLQPAVQQAISAHRNWAEVTGSLSAGPLRERLSLLGEQVQAGVLELYATAVRVGEVERVLASLDPPGATEAYKAARRQALDGHPPPELEALEARFGSVQRMMNLVTDADEQLRVIDARLLAAVARGAELAITADPGALAGLGADLDAVVRELGSVRESLVSFR